MDGAEAGLPRPLRRRRDRLLWTRERERSQLGPASWTRPNVLLGRHALALLLYVVNVVALAAHTARLHQAPIFKKEHQL